MKKMPPLLSRTLLCAGLVFSTFAGNCPNDLFADGGVGLGDGDGDDDGNGSPEDRLIDAVIDATERCREEESSSYRLRELTDPDYQAIQGIDYAAYYRAYFHTLFDSPHIEVDLAAVSACAALYETLECGESIESPNACDDIFTGTQSEGETCATSVECAEGLACNYADDAECGACTPGSDQTGPAGEGESCDNTYCDEGLTESWDENNSCTCVPLPGEGESCDAIYECQEGLGVVYTAEGCVCGVPVGVGEPCYDTASYENIAPCNDGGCDYDTGLCVGPAADGESCEAVSCGDGLYCDYDDYVCRTFVEGDSVGDPCTVGGYGSCGWVDETALYCAGEGTGPGACADVNIAEVGEACDETGDTFCRGRETTTFCAYDWDTNTGECQPRSAVGATCDYYVPCHYEARCVIPDGSDTGTCVALPTSGEACIDGYFCAPGYLCDDDICRTAAEYLDATIDRLEMCWES